MKKVTIMNKFTRITEIKKKTDGLVDTYDSTKRKNVGLFKLIQMT